MLSRHSRPAALLVALAPAFCILHAQDTRNVAEPVPPSACTVLTANLTSVDGGKTLAEADEGKLDSERIQNAIDACPKGKAVELRADGPHDAFLSGPLDLRPGITLRVAAKTILFGSRDARLYDLRPGSCGIVDKAGHGCRAMINGEGAPDSAVMGEGTIDGRGWATILGKKDSWWDLAEQARAGGNQSCPRIIVVNHSDNFTLYNVTLKNSGNFHVSYSNGNGFTAWGVVINTPRNARNTDGIDPSASTNVTITRCFIHTGDDNVAIKAGGHVSHMTIAHNHFYTGHGMSIGSETNGGADTIRVSDLSIDGADNGIRIKSNAGKGGLVQDVVYTDVCIRDTKNPIYMDSDYAHFGKNGDKLPHFTGIILRGIRIEGGGKITLQGFDEKHALEMTFDNVTADSAANLKITAEYAGLAFGPGPVNIRPAGPSVTIKDSAGKGAPNACANRFVPMPEKPAALYVAGRPHP
jgi:polygalacturonase